MPKKNSTSFWITILLLAALSVFSIISFSGDGSAEDDKDRMTALVSGVTSLWQWVNIVPSRDTSERLYKGISAAQDSYQEVEGLASEVEKPNDFALILDNSYQNDGSVRFLKDDWGWYLEIIGHDGRSHIFHVLPARGQ